MWRATDSNTQRNRTDAGTPKPAAFAEELLVNGRKVAQVNILTLDFIKTDFDRSNSPGTPLDPEPELAFQVANDFLRRVRAYSRAFQITPVVVGRDSWWFRYLTDDERELEPEAGKVRGKGGGVVTIGFPAVTPDILQMVADRWESAEPYGWDFLLLDARALLPDVGSAVVMAAAALETFIAWALNILHDGQPLPNGLWHWINNRDHWTKNPSGSDEFDVLLRVLAGRSLKDDEPALWKDYMELRQARNRLAHDGVATVGGRPVEPEKARQLIDAAEKVVAWVEALLPEVHRRVRTAAVGPFLRKFATQEESALLGPARLANGELGQLPPGGSVGFAFDAKPPVEQANVEKSPRDDGGETTNPASGPGPTQNNSA